MLEVKNVSYAYKTKKDKTILNNVSAGAITMWIMVHTQNSVICLQ